MEGAEDMEESGSSEVSEDEDEQLIEEDTQEEGEEGEDMTSQVKEFFSELNIDESKQKKRFLLNMGIKFPRRKSVLPPHLHSVMGSANLKLARGDSSAAIELCKEVIRQAPQASEPYLTLATIYEELQDEAKLFRILLIAAHLKRTDSELWLKSATLAKKENNLRVAAQCISKALSIEGSRNVQLLWERATLYCQMEENKRAIESFEQILKVLPQEAEHEHVEVVKELATLYHEVNNTAKAMEILGEVLLSHPHLVDEELINLLAELCLVSKAYGQVYEVITEFYHMIDQSSFQEDGAASKSESHDLPEASHDPPEAPHDPMLPDVSLTTALRISISGEGMEIEEGTPADSAATAAAAAAAAPLKQLEEEDNLILSEDIPVDLRVKLTVAMINLGKKIPEKLLEPVFSSPEDYGDLLLDIAEAFMDNGEYAEALPLLSALVGTSNYSQAGVWFKQAECQYVLSDLEGAIVSYSKVLSLAPHHTESRLQLATLYVQMGHPDDALAVLESDPNPEKDYDSLEPAQADVMASSSDQVPPATGTIKATAVQDLRVTVQKHKLLFSAGKLAEYVKTGCSLLAFLFRDVYRHPQIKVMVKLKIKTRKMFRHLLSESRREESDLLSVQEWFAIYRETCEGLLKLGTPSSHYKLTYFIYCAVTVAKFSGELEKPFIFLSVSLSYIMRDYGTVFMLLRDLCYKDSGNKHLWNFFNMLPFDDVYRKFLLRLCHKYHGPFMLRLLANFSMASTSVNNRFCLHQYEKEFREGGQKDYLLSLCLALVYINMGCQVKNPPNRNAVISMAAGFLHTYMRLRGECQESMYNMGRAFHQLGLVHIACHFYKKVLLLEPECKSPEWTEASDLRCEAAFNLSLIYRASGNFALARNMLRRYCTV